MNYIEPSTTTTPKYTRNGNVIKIGDFGTEAARLPKYRILDQLTTERTEQYKKRPFSRESIKSLDENERAQVDEAFDLITGALDDMLVVTERSNSFDDWSTTLEMISRKIGNFTSQHRIILGSLIVVIRDKDISDFDNETLSIFQQATNLLRQPRVAKAESRQIIKSMLEKKLKIGYPLYVEEESEEIAEDHKRERKDNT